MMVRKELVMLGSNSRGKYSCKLRAVGWNQRTRKRMVYDYLRYPDPEAIKCVGSNAVKQLGET
jgi:hypothetical protein